MRVTCGRALVGALAAAQSTPAYTTASMFIVASEHSFSPRHRASGMHRREIRRNRRNWQPPIRRSGARGAHMAFVDPTELVSRLQHLPIYAYGAICVGCNMIPFFPGQALNAGAGGLYGFGKGWPLVCASQALSAAIAFEGARCFSRTARFKTILAFVERSAAVRKVIEVLSAITSRRRAAGTGGGVAALWAAFLTTLLLRQAPIVPFSISNYVLGALSDLPLLPFCLGTLVGCALGNAVVVAAGAAGRNLGNLRGMGDLGGVGTARTAAVAALALVGAVAFGAFLFRKVGEATVAVPPLPVADADGGGAAAKTAASEAAAPLLLPPPLPPLPPPPLLPSRLTGGEQRRLDGR
ncbi:unnamed protein product [Phaeothamnion confervicola]